MTKSTALSESNALAEKDTGRSNISRRKFLNYAGASTGLVLLASACTKTDTNNGVDLGSGDTGILNYAYALEQLEAAFYTQVIANKYTGMSDVETTYLTNIRDHEIAHREFFKAALSTSAIPALEVDFSTIDFKSRASVLGAAMTFEDLGVAAYNGAGALITNPTYLTVAGKIVSVEARHAAYIRNLVKADSFVAMDVVDVANTGLEKSKSPSVVLSQAAPFIKTKINASNLPS